MKIMLALLCASILSAESIDSLSVSGGRYVFGQISEYRSDKFILDTKTGAIWSFARDDNTSGLFPVYYMQFSDGKFRSSQVAPTYIEIKK